MKDDPVAVDLPGVALTDDGARVCVYSANAEAMFFCLYDESGDVETLRVKLDRRADDAFCAKVLGVRAGARYGLRAAGPFDPARGHRFDVQKLLADPYATSIDRPFKLHGSMFQFGADSGPHAPKSVIARMPGRKVGSHRIPTAQTILYELNLRGFTRLNMSVPEADRGTFAGLAHESAIGHLASLGVTSVEIMPADAFVDERHLPPLGLTNAWGYNPVILGAPDPRLAPKGWADVRFATDALHAAGMEAILDIVLNHSGESDEFGPTLSMRGLDNASYYRLMPGDEARYVNDMGCGNCLALDRPPVMRLAIAALRRWVLYGGVDGFRFDLATAIGRRSWGFDPQAPLLELIAADDVLQHAKLIAEPWDIGPGGYQLGHFPPDWAEWNDRYRDDVRRYWRGDTGMRGALATRFAGSSDMFPKSLSPAKSVNFITAHDGFTLADLVSYEHKHNEANGEANRDGSNDNRSWNNGVEGPSEDPLILGARGRDMRNLIATLMVSRGTPMLSMGAETGHSQNGNNNAYAQDNAVSWLDWSRADQGLIAFTQRLIALRKTHPALKSDDWLTGRALDANGIADVQWRDAVAPLASAAQWQDAQAHVLVAVLAGANADKVERLLVAFNGGSGEAEIHLPEPRERMEWRIVVDTGGPDSTEERLASADDKALAAARSCLILVEAVAPPSRISRAPASAELIGRLANAAGISPDWWDVSGARTIVSNETRLALLAGMRLPARTRKDAQESLRRIVDQREARRLPYSLLGRDNAPMSAPLRDELGAPIVPLDLRIETEDGRVVEWRADRGDTASKTLLDGRLIAERRIALPQLPLGRHRLLAGEVACELTIAPAAAYLAEGAQRKRFGLSAQLYAQRRESSLANADQGIGDFTTLGLLGEAIGRAGAAMLGVNPLHALFPENRERVSPYHPSDRRFLDPLNIDIFDGAGLPTDETLQAALAAGLAGISVVANNLTVDYVNVWRLKRVLLQARWMAFERARIVRPADPIFADFDAFVSAGGNELRNFTIFQAIAQARDGEDWRNWPQSLREANKATLDKKADELGEQVSFGMFTQWLADRQLAKAAARAKAGGLELGLYRDLAVGAAPDGAEAWARADHLMTGASVGAPPDPFSANGQIWHLPPPDPLAGDRDGWRGLASIYGANMRHAGLLRLDHAMGLARLFIIPDGAKPAAGAYVGYPLNDLVGNLALESHRRRCMVVGEDLGTVPEGLRETLTSANIIGMRVLWFERNGADFLAPSTYPALAVACASTHDLPTLAGWWNGIDIAEQMSLGLISLDDAQKRIGERSAEKRALVAALTQAGLIAREIDFVAPVSDAFAGAVHAWLASAGSMLASAQVDDLAGQRVGTNLPGTNNERPNWRHRLERSIDTLMNTSRAQAIINGLATSRR
jgi:glycogen debranching enzyme GlgX/4-alpha-glucanotransferase